MSKCGKVKNPCKYCLEQVTNKTGLQCEGACKKWAHFRCLHYTPGKISDIKAGIIKVMCPCPDCETTQIKEYIVNPPYTCSNHKCPANSPGLPKCDSMECPANAKCPPRPCPPKPCSPPPCPPRPCPPKPPCSPPPCPPKPCPPKPCSPPPCSPKPCTPPPCTPPPCPPLPCPPPPCPPRPACPPPCPPPPCPPACTIPNRRASLITPSTSSSVDSCTNPRCPSNTSIKRNGTRPSPGQASMALTLREMCGTVGTLSQQLKELMCKINDM